MEQSGDDNNECPISHLTQDHLFSILLLLPIKSILSFALTCKKFNALVSSDTLWQSICRRDWGPSCVDALKSSFCADNGGIHVPWMKLYKQVAQLGSVACLKLTDPVDDGPVPCPRASHSLNFVSNCLVLFGGGHEGGT
uniref:F-box domain-containing protein n=1 Tax=Opuntia streptacantha TaxID=393608 RepID=A0A7C9E8R1_OPUST